MYTLTTKQGGAKDAPSLVQQRVVSHLARSTSSRHTVAGKCGGFGGWAGGSLGRLKFKYVGFM